MEGYSPLTLKTYCFQYNLLLQFFGDINMSELTTEKLKEYLIQAGDHLKPSSLGHRVRCIKSLFKWTHEEGYIPMNPVDESCC
ncbi:phage integrase N-terminal SAM-like domain-containing protein [Metabacillus arenae]|uniref:phage integrase N-terminal SAM-like domain-containing protein n=1 Tax=Metabacillus arenae TaxID=2771434 RepID=UPI0037C56CD3